MPVCTPLTQSNRQIITKKRLCSYEHSRPAIKKPYPTKREYIFYAQHAKPINKKIPVVPIFCSLPLKGKQRRSAFCKASKLLVNPNRRVIQIVELFFDLCARCNSNDCYTPLRFGQQAARISLQMELILKPRPPFAGSAAEAHIPRTIYRT